MSLPRRLRTANAPEHDHTCRVVVQAVLAGPVEYAVQGMTPLAGPGHRRISIRLGRVVLVLQDRDAYEAMKRAWREAEAVADRALPELPASAGSPTTSH